ncbi:hypothetical protein BT96DRAFT_792652, partial [Gymnopus androsaceus JB14]
LIDSGASKSFVDYNLAGKYPNFISSLSKPMPLTLFDGNTTSAGNMMQKLNASIQFEDGTVHMENFLITKLHPTRATPPIVLGLPWLQRFNPQIDW